MFHYSDLLSLARHAPWIAPPSDSGQALARRQRRRRFSTQPADAPDLRLPDLKYLDPLVQAASRVDNRNERCAATVLAACLEAPALTYASPRQSDGGRVWRRLAMISDLGVAGLLAVAGTPGKRSVRIADAQLRIVDLSDVRSVRDMIEEVHICGDRPHRDVRNRGRATAPSAMWLGLPTSGASEDFERRAGAIAAVDGYVLEVIGHVPGNTRQVLARTANMAPELVVVWNPYVPPGDFAGRVSSLVSTAAVHLIDDADPERALERFRVHTTQHSVEEVDGDALRTMRDAAVLARSVCKHVQITDQAIQRAGESPYQKARSVFDALRALDAIAGEFADTNLAAPDFAQACGDQGLLYSRDISTSAAHLHRDDYLVQWNGQKRLMGPHLRFGDSWDPRFCARVYWWVDTTSQQLIVGHIGVHLPGGDD